MKETTKIMVIIFTGSPMIAHGLRMMIQGVLYPNSYYPASIPSTINFWFDWFLLSIFGIGILYFGAKQYSLLYTSR